MPDPTPATPAAATPAAAALSDADLLSGHDPTERLVGIHADGPAAVRLYTRHADGRVTSGTAAVHPFVFLTDANLLDGFRRARVQRLAGNGPFAYVAVFPDRGAQFDALRHIERAAAAAAGTARPADVYTVGGPEQQYLMQTGRTLFKGMTFDEVRRLQLDIEVVAKNGFPQADVPEHRVVLVAMSDSTGWQHLVGAPGMSESEILRETVRIVQDRDPDVIEGHNCLLPGARIWTVDGPAPVETLGPGCVFGTAGPQPSPGFVARPFSGDAVTLHTERGGTLATTSDHPHLVATAATTRWTPAGQVAVGDYVAGPRRLDVPVVPDDFSESDYYAAGLIWSDGHIPLTPNLVWFSNTDSDLLDWMRGYMGPGRFEKRRVPALLQHAPLTQICLSGAALRARLADIGVPQGNKLDTEVTFARVCRASEPKARAFLRGVIDGDGHVRTDMIVIASASASFRAVVRFLALRLGLQSSEGRGVVRLYPTEDAFDRFDELTAGLVCRRKRCLADRTRALRDDLPPEAARILKRFVRRRGQKAAGVWGLDYADIPLPRTTVSYVLNGRTRLSRRTASVLTRSIDAAIGGAPPARQVEWQGCRQTLAGLAALSWYRVRSVAVAPYEGPVYNTTTPDHTYVAGGLLTHNCYGFDLPYLAARCRMHHVPFALGRDGSEPRTFPSSIRFAERQIEFDAAEIAGRHIVDTMFLAMAYDVFARSLPNYTLKGVAKHFGFAPEGRTYVPGDEIAEVWESDPSRIMDYALDDVVETERIARHLSGGTFYLTQMLPMPYGLVARSGPAGKIEALFVRAYLRARHSLPRAQWGSQHVGGYTDVFVTGVVGPVVYADVESLYPSIMLEYGVQPAGDALGLFPRLLRTLTALRLDTKAAMQAAPDADARGELDARQTAYKNIINSFYGNLGFQFALFNDFAEADRVATTGQQILRRIIAAVRRAGGRVIEVDTDGVLFVPPPGVRGEAAERAFVAALSSGMPAGIRIGFDGRYRAMLSYKKKNYALLGHDGTLAFKGSSLVSRSSERFGRAFVRDATRLLLDADERGPAAIADLHALFLDTRARIAAHDWRSADRFQRVETLKLALDEYQREVAGGRTRSAAYEVALREAARTGRPVRRGERVAYYIAAARPNEAAAPTGGRVFELARPAAAWDPAAPDESAAFYLDRLDALARRFEPFFETPAQHRLVFSPEDLFGFDPAAVRLVVAERAPEEVEDDVPF